jgi:hypothetical protein
MIDAVNIGARKLPMNVMMRVLGENSLDGRQH